MSAIAHPTLVVALGPFGRAVAARLSEDAGALSETERARLQTASVPTPAELAKAGGPADPLGQLKRDLETKLRALLRAGVTSGQPQLDLAIVADVTESGAELLVAVAHATSEVLATSFAVLFPPSLPAHQRTVWLNVVLGSPALADTEAGRAAIQAVGHLERWHLGEVKPPSPCLSRVWLLPRQTASGVLSDEDVQRSAYLFLSTAYLCGQRSSDALRARLETPRDQSKLVGTVSVAAADVPVGRVLDYCTWRTALAGLDLLALQAEANPNDDAAVDAAMGPLGADQWLWSFDEGDAARALRARAVAAVPRRVVKARPTPPKLGESGEQTLARWQEVLAGDEFPDQLENGRPKVPEENDQALKAADVAETQAVEDALEQVSKFVEAKLEPSDALHSVGLLHRGLGRLAERFEKLAEKPVPEASAPKTNEPSQATDDGLGPVREAASRKPSLIAALPSALALGFVVAVAVAGIFAVVSMRESAAPAAAGPTIKNIGGQGLAGASLASVLLPGIGVGLVASFGWLFASMGMAASGLRKALQAFESTKTERASSGTSPGAIANRGAESTLAVRRRRVARALARALRERQSRLQALRTSLQTARKQARDELARLGVRPGNVIAEDAVGELLPPQTPLHWPLYPPTAMPLLCQRTREVRDDSVWAQRLLESGWPESGLRDDLPFCDAAVWSKAARAQHGVLTDSGPFGWPDVGALLPTRVADFLREAPHALGFGLRPMREDGNRVNVQGEGELLALAPMDARTAIDAAQRTGTVPTLQWMWSPGASPRLVILTTGTEFDAASAWRGLGR